MRHIREFTLWLQVIRKDLATKRIHHRVGSRNHIVRVANVPLLAPKPDLRRVPNCLSTALLVGPVTVSRKLEFVVEAKSLDGTERRGYLACNLS